MRYFSVQKLSRVLLSAILLGIPFLSLVTPIDAATLTSANIQLSDPTPSNASTTYTANFTFPGTTSIKCIKVLFSTTPTGSTEPAGMSTTGATGSSLSGGGLTNGSWPIFATNDGAPQYEDSGAQASTATAIALTLTGITNPNTASTFYAQITTYTTLTTHTCSVAQDTVTVAFATTTGIAASVTVDPTLTFAVNAVASSGTVNGSTTTVTTTSSTIPFGSVTSGANGIAAHSLVVTTNAGSGYTVYIKYSGVPTSGSNTIADFTGTNATPATFSAAGTAAFGYTTESQTLSGAAGTGSGQASRFNNGTNLNKWAKFTTANLEVARNTVAVSSDTTKVGYQVGVAGTTPPGTYTTTVTLTATPTY